MMIAQAVNPCFNSKMVRLIGEAQRTAIQTLACFNSKMVRLIVHSVALAITENGSFNSKMVRLIDMARLRNQQLELSFNSKMVRLIGEGLLTQRAGARFQFQNGSINSPSPSRGSALTRVSIPKWFD